MTLIVGLGNPYGGDDSVGLVVAGRLRAAGFDASTAVEPSAIVTLLATSKRVVIVDAMVDGGVPGRVVHLSGAELSDASESPASLGVRRRDVRVSSHGLGIAAAVAMARALGGEQCASDVHVVAIAIEPPRAAGTALSAPVAGAVDEAVAVAQALARG